MTEQSQEALEAEFDMMMARAGVTVPAERRAAVLSGFKDLRGSLHLLRNGRTAAAEPSNVFRLSPQK